MDDSWSTEAACHGVGAEVFFPADDEDAGAATAICDRCAVREPCLEYALERRERAGVWGGCTERERRRIVRRRRRAAS